MKKYDTNSYGGNAYLGRPFSLDPLINRDEDVIWEGKPNRRAFILERILGMAPFALIWGAFDVFIITLIISSTMNADSGVDTVNSVPWMIIIPFFAIHMAPVWIWIGSLFTAKQRWKRTYYMATTHKIIIRTGLIGAEYNILFYPEISNVSLKIGFLDRMFKVGDIHFTSNESRGVSSSVFNDIDNPQSFFPVVQKIVLDARADMYYPNKLRPENNSRNGVRDDVNDDD